MKKQERLIRPKKLNRKSTLILYEYQTAENCTTNRAISGVFMRLDKPPTASIRSQSYEMQITPQMKLNYRKSGRHDRLNNFAQTMPYFF